MHKGKLDSTARQNEPLHATGERNEHARLKRHARYRARKK